VAATLSLKVLSDRTESTLKPMLEAYERAHGVKITAVYVDDGLLTRLQSRPTEADVVISKDAELLELARQKGLIRPFKSGMISTQIPKSYRQKDDYYFVDAYRARAIIYSKARVKPEQLSTYADLASPKWKGRLCVRSGFHDYNVALFSQIAAASGDEEARKIIKGLHENLARVPRGSDRDQAKAIYDGICDVALLNTYYFPMMKDNPEQKSWAEAVDLFYPDQNAGGSFVLRSALALTKATKNAMLATNLLEFFADKSGQDLVAKSYQFPTNTEVAMSPALKSLGSGQKEVVTGQFKANLVPLELMAAKREVVIKMLNEIDFDKH
jgi:iron(III) transport system substrate-binding protein